LMSISLRLYNYARVIHLLLNLSLIILKALPNKQCYVLIF